MSERLTGVRFPANGSSHRFIALDREGRHDRVTSHRSLARAPVATVLLALAVLAAIAALFANHRLAPRDARADVRVARAGGDDPQRRRGSDGLAASERRAWRARRTAAERRAYARLRRVSWTGRRTGCARGRHRALCRQVAALQRDAARRRRRSAQPQRERDRAVAAIEDHAPRGRGAGCSASSCCLGALLLALFAGAVFALSRLATALERSASSTQTVLELERRRDRHRRRATEPISYANPAAKRITGIGALGPADRAASARTRSPDPAATARPAYVERGAVLPRRTASSSSSSTR